MNMKEIIKKVFFTEILKGMALTLSRLFTKPVTRQYPEEKKQALPGFRGLHALARRLMEQLVVLAVGFVRQSVPQNASMYIPPRT